MKMCQSHWDKLRKAIADRGLSQFVAKSGQEAVKRIAGEGFDPLIGAHNAIISNALGVAGLQIMQPNEDGSESCPLCFLAAKCPCPNPHPCAHFETWIDRAADDSRDEAIKRGLVATT